MPGYSLESPHPVSLSLFDCFRANAVAVLDAVDQWQGASRDDFVFILAVATERDLRFDAFQRAFTGRVFVTGAVLASVEEPGAHGWRVVVAFGRVLFGFPFGVFMGFFADSFPLLTVFNGGIFSGGARLEGCRFGFLLGGDCAFVRFFRYFGCGVGGRRRRAATAA